MPRSRRRRSILVTSNGATNCSMSCGIVLYDADRQSWNVVYRFCSIMIISFFPPMPLIGKRQFYSRTALILYAEILSLSDAPMSVFQDRLLDPLDQRYTSSSSLIVALHWELSDIGEFFVSPRWIEFSPRVHLISSRSSKRPVDSVDAEGTRVFRAYARDERGRYASRESF